MSRDRDNSEVLERQFLMKKIIVSSVSEGEGTIDGLTVVVEEGVLENCMSFTLAYGTDLTADGRTQ